MTDAFTKSERSHLATAAALAFIALVRVDRVVSNPGDRADLRSLLDPVVLLLLDTLKVDIDELQTEANKMRGIPDRRAPAEIRRLIATLANRAAKAS